MKRSVAFCVTFSAACLLASADMPAGVFHHQKSLKILIQSLCSSSEESDACRGCFWSLSSSLQDPFSSGKYPNCTQHLPADVKEACGYALEETIDAKNETAFCEFEQCSRGVYSKRLIRQCMEKERGDANDKIEIYTKTTKCLLCKAHCLDRKFREQFEYGARNTALTMTKNGQLTFTLAQGTGDKLCLRSGPEDSQDTIISECDCKAIGKEL